MTLTIDEGANHVNNKNWRTVPLNQPFGGCIVLEPITCDNYWTMLWGLLAELRIQIFWSDLDFFRRIISGSDFFRMAVSEFGFFRKVGSGSRFFFRKVGSGSAFSERLDPKLDFSRKLGSGSGFFKRLDLDSVFPKGGIRFLRNGGSGISLNTQIRMKKKKSIKNMYTSNYWKKPLKYDISNTFYHEI